MVAPLASGTVLRQRYVIQQMLGQGGFGRTYLALDQERFNELCVLKELIVPYQDATLIAKSKSLFQREASILYQIDHPQIPQFWAAFEDENRLFLGQSYVEGQTYRQFLGNPPLRGETTLNPRQGRTFSELEVLHFLSQMLPVLSYIHDRNIIHRDITPENIILQMPGVKNSRVPIPALGLPVLIDFGAVKEATNHWFLASMSTRVGKVGYAPPEQLQTGMVSPSSDLYSLAATCLTLLTGKEPQQLLDGATLSWRWNSCGNLRQELVAILSRMLAIYPGDRYLSAETVLTELKPLLETNQAQFALGQASQLKASLPPERQPTLSTAATSLPLSALPFNDSASSRPLPLRSNRPGGRWRIAGLATLAILGAALPVIWRLLNPMPNGEEVWVSGARVPRSEASRIIELQTSQSRAALKDRSKNQTIQPVQVLQFSPGKISTAVQGNLFDGQTQPYSLRALQGQIMTATLVGAEVTMNLTRSNGEPINIAAAQTQSWTGQLPAEDEYSIQVTGKGDYSLEVVITPLSRPSQEQIERINLAQGNHATTVTGQINSNQVRRYLLQAKQGQLLRIKLLEGQIKFRAIAPTGQPIIYNSIENQKEWQDRLPQAGDYVIELTTQKSNTYALLVEIY
jgi:serine/threonine-protein kinase